MTFLSKRIRACRHGCPAYVSLLRQVVGSKVQLRRDPGATICPCAHDRAPCAIINAAGCSSSSGSTASCHERGSPNRCSRPESGGLLQHCAGRRKYQQESRSSNTCSFRCLDTPCWRAGECACCPGCDYARHGVCVSLNQRRHQHNLVSRQETQAEQRRM
jgi:hypothetical protein